jgi:hypothetical protein
MSSRHYSIIVAGNKLCTGSHVLSRRTASSRESWAPRIHQTLVGVRSVFTQDPLTSKICGLFTFRPQVENAFPTLPESGEQRNLSAYGLSTADFGPLASGSKLFHRVCCCNKPRGCKSAYPSSPIELFTSILNSQNSTLLATICCTKIIISLLKLYNCLVKINYFLIL